jgi:hypothetical protein
MGSGEYLAFAHQRSRAVDHVFLTERIQEPHDREIATRRTRMGDGLGDPPDLLGRTLAREEQHAAEQDGNRSHAPPLS